jgi:hypothetical protein
LSGVAGLRERGFGAAWSRSRVFLQSVRPCGCTDVFCWGVAGAGLVLPATGLEFVAGGEADIVELMLRFQHIVHNSFMDTKPATRHPITCEFGGETHKATYWVAGKILTVATGRGGKSKQVGTMEPEVLARQLLLELVKAGKA